MENNNIFKYKKDVDNHLKFVRNQIIWNSRQNINTS